MLIIGEPGLGKSRLIEEFHAKLGEVPHSWAEWAARNFCRNDTTTKISFIQI